MAARQGLRRQLQSIDSFASTICQPCLRRFAASAIAQAGHNKWSKTKHIKAVTDKKKTLERTAFTKTITLYSRLYGEDLRFNPQLANTIALATKASVPKAIIENAIARGQGRSTTGASLEPLTFEIIVAPNIAIIAEAETDSKIRTLGDVRSTIKKAGGLASASAFYFTKRGRSIFKSKEKGPTLSEMIEEAIEHDGAEDIEELPDGGFLAWTQPTSLNAVTEALMKKFNLEIVESEIIWSPNEDTLVELDAPEKAGAVANLLSGLQEYTEIKAIYANLRQGSIADDEWDKVARNLDM